MLNYISLTNYRNLKKFKALDLGQKNVIIAPNGSGKTNILESVYLSVTGESFKPYNSFSDFINLNADFCRIETKWDLDLVEVIIQKSQNTIKKDVFLNKKRTLNTKIKQKFPVILFAPNSVDIVTSDPTLRREDINHFLSITDESYKKDLLNFKTVLKNRNATLKNIQEGKSPLSTLNFWTDKIIELNYKIFTKRNEFFKTIEPYFLEAKNIFFKDQNITIDCIYLPNQNYLESEFKKQLFEKFLNNQQKEIIVGSTLYGVQKDDFSINYNNLNLKFLGSRGQQRIGISIFKFAQILYFYNLKNFYPILLLDDIMSELDDLNRHKISEYILSKDIQFILTSAEKKEVPSLILSNSISLSLN